MRRHVVGSIVRIACDDRVVTARFFFDNFGKNRTIIVGRPQGLSKKSNGLLKDIAWAPYDFHLKSVETLRSPYDLPTISVWF